MYNSLRCGNDGWLVVQPYRTAANHRLGLEWCTWLFPCGHHSPVDGRSFPPLSASEHSSSSSLPLHWSKAPAESLSISVEPSVFLLVRRVTDDHRVWPMDLSELRGWYPSIADDHWFWCNSLGSVLDDSIVFHDDGGCTLVGLDERTRREPLSGKGRRDCTEEILE